MVIEALKWVIGVFSPYVNSFERKIDNFFTNVKSTDSIFAIQGDLLKLMQQNLVVVNVWMEKKFKGYLYLNKGVRRKMYADTELIVKKFNEYCDSVKISDDQIKQTIEDLGMVYPSGNKMELRHLICIMSFLRPGVYYNYIQTSSFGKLLRDPNREKLEGDCNQIVTLYIYLYSLKFKVTDLQIKLLPEHVCLHFRGVDIEATAGQFAKYTKFDHLLPVTEIISTNLLDLNDFREDTQKIDERTIVKSAQLAYAISSLKSMVEKNLEVAYHNLGVDSYNKKDFKAAIFYVSRAKDKEFLQNIYRAACAHFIEQKDFSKAKYYASESGDRELSNQVDKAEFAKKYNDLAAKVSEVKTLDDAKSHKSDYKQMLELAINLQDEKLQNNVREILKKL